MSIAPHTGIVDFGTFTPATSSLDGIQGEVPAPLAGQELYILTASGWAPGGSGSGTVTSVAATAGTGISITGSPITTSGTLNITNTAPDQTVGLTAGTGISVTGTYPNFTVTNTSPSSGGTVTSVSGTGTVNGITLTGTVTGSGNLTLGGSITGFATSGANTDISSVTLTTGTITTAPSSSTDIVNKSYADSLISGVNFHAACQYATTAALGSYVYNNGISGVGATITKSSPYSTLVIDGHTFVSPADIGKRVLIKDEPAIGGFDAYNGVYTVTDVGSGSTPWILTRATDFDTAGSGVNQIDAGDLLLVLQGSTNANTSWVQQTPLPITVGTTGIIFIEFAAVQTYTAGTGLTLNTNQFSITNVGTAGTYGSASSVPVITTNGQGQVTGVTNTSIAISGSAVSGNISGNAANVTGTVAIANGGTGQTSQQTAINALAGSVASGQYLRGNGTNVVMSAIQASDVPTLNQNTTGTASNVTGTVAVANGGTGLTSISALSVPVANVANTYTTVTGTAGQSIRVNAGGTAWEAFTPGTGTVTSVTGTSPVASSGGNTPAISLSSGYGDTQNPYASKTANFVLAAPNGSAGLPTFRAIVAADIPTLNQNTTGTASNVTGTVAVVNGGTGQTTYTDGQLLIGNTTGNTLAKATLTAGDGISITNGAGSITVASPLAESTSVFVTGSAQTYTAPANTQWVKVTVVGPGGNGGAANNQRATGGGGGGVAIKWLAMSSGQTLTYTVGTASGTASTVSSGTLAITTISGGSGANGAGTAYAASVTAGAAGGTASGGDVNIAGGLGGASYGSAATVATNISGKGGDCPGFGTGGNAVGFVATAGTQGNGFGAGGGGSHGNNTVANGRGGIIIFEAY